MKSIQLQILALLVVVAASSACDDPCFCPSGTYMYCRDRGLTRPPEGYWPNIQTVDLSGNRISTLYKNSFSGYPNAVAMYLQQNLLSEIDMAAIAAMSQLKVLYLDNNSIANIISAPEAHFDLHQLFLNNNSLASLDPDTFLNAPNLLTLFLNNNPIVVPRGQAIVNNPSLEILHLQHGSSVVVGPETFAGLPLLREVVLISAGITSIQGAFVSNTRLTNVILYYNLITEVTAGTFPSGNAMTGLYLSYNPLERLDVAAVDKALAPGANLEINDTPLACSCNYESLYWWAQLRSVNLRASCGGVNKCSFTRQMKP